MSNAFEAMLVRLGGDNQAGWRDRGERLRRVLSQSTPAVDIFECDTPALGLQQAGLRDIGAVLLDVAPGDGIAAIGLVEDLRRRYTDMPILALIEHRRQELADRLRAAGVNEVLVDGEHQPDHLPERLRGAVRVHRAEDRAKRLTAQWQESEERFRAMADTAPVFLWVAERDGSRSYFNQGWLRFRGRSIKEEIGNGWTDGIHPEDRVRCQDLWRQHSRAAEAFELEYRLQRDDGEFRWILEKAKPRFLTNGSFVGYVGSCVDVTERHVTEDALREASHAKSAVIQASPVAIYTLDSAGLVKTWNSASEKIFGYTAGEVIDKPLAVVMPGARREFDDVCKTALHGERVAGVETICRRQDGSEVAVSLSAAPLFDGAGRANGVVVLSEDISQRKSADLERQRLLQLERAARGEAEAAQRRLSFLAEASEVMASSLEYQTTLAGVARLAVPGMASWCGVYMLDEAGKIVCLELTHVDPAKVQLARDFQVKYPTEQNSNSSIAKVIRTGQPEVQNDIDEAFVRARARDDEHSKAVCDLGISSVMVVPLATRERTFGAIVFASSEPERRYGAADLALAQDLARRASVAVDNARLYQQARAAVIEKDSAAALLDTLLRTAPVGMAFFDTQFRYVRINQALAAINGLPMEKHLGRALPELFPGIWLHVGPLLQQVLETSTPVLDVEMTIATQGTGDDPRDWLCSHYPVRGGDGKVIGIGCVVSDITERKRAEKELTDARDTAESANQAKDQFLAVLSHELRTPLTPVLTTVTALQAEGDALPEELKSSLEMIRRNVELEARLIDDLLDLTRISKGKLRLNMETVDAHVSLQRAIDICKADIGAKHLSISTDLSATRTHVRADAARLQQVFWNLIKNAVKFTPNGASIAFRSKNLDDRVVIEIQDTGIGIDAEVLPRIFFAFEQAEQSIARRFGGLGLGLAISKSLIDMHAGRLTASSKGRDKGATFTVDLAVVEKAKAAAPRQSPGWRHAEPNRVRILMVDDHEDTSVAMKRLLERLGYQVSIANSVQSALEAGKHPFDLLISDIGLPDGSGLDLMRQLSQTRPIKGIALSGFGMEDDIQRSKAAGFVEHLTKPVNFDRLEAIIQQLTSQAR